MATLYCAFKIMIFLVKILRGTATIYLVIFNQLESSIPPLINELQLRGCCTIKGSLKYIQSNLYP
jgi:hypothetical protein